MKFDVFALRYGQKTVDAGSEDEAVKSVEEDGFKDFVWRNPHILGAVERKEDANE